MHRNSTTTIAARLNAPTEGKAIRYDRETRDYACFLDGQYIGHADTFSAAESRISAVYYDQLAHTVAASADAEAEYAEVYITEDAAELLNSAIALPLTPALARALRDALNAPTAVAWMGA